MFERLKASVTGLFAKHAPDVRDAIENIGEVASAQAARAKEFAGDAVEKVSELKDEAIAQAAIAVNKADDFKDESVVKFKEKQAAAKAVVEDTINRFPKVMAALAASEAEDEKKIKKAKKAKK